MALPNRSFPDATLIPTRSYPDLDAAVRWLCDALGFEERLRVPGERVQLTIGNGAIIVAAWTPDPAAPSGGGGGRPPATLMIRVADVNVGYERALAMGGTSVRVPTDHPFGERQAEIKDPAGHSWTLSQTMADVEPSDWGAHYART